VLMTGASGFVGAHLLAELESHAEVARIHVLLRTDKAGSGLDSRLAESLRRFELALSPASPKIVLVEGDLTKPGLGLSAPALEMLASEVDAIYHVGAQVNHLLPYTALKVPNVDSTAHLMRLALQGRSKVVNFISTLGAAARRTAEGLLAEDFPDDTSLESEMGYFQSKWASERLLALFHAKGHRANIFRLGRITGHSCSGVSLHQDNQLFMLIKGCIQLGFAPRMERLINMTPIDTVSRLMAAPAFQVEGGHVLNVFNNTDLVSWNEIVDWLALCGYAIEQIPFASWQHKLMSITPDNAIFKFSPLYGRKDAEHKVLSSAINVSQYACASAQSAMARHGIHYDKTKSELLAIYFGYFWRTGFLPPPGPHRTSVAGAPQLDTA